MLKIPHFCFKMTSIDLYIAVTILRKPSVYRTLHDCYGAVEIDASSQSDLEHDQNIVTPSGHPRISPETSEESISNATYENPALNQSESTVPIEPETHSFALSPTRPCPPLRSPNRISRNFSVYEKLRRTDCGALEKVAAKNIQVGPL